ncbi:hypothetical protein DFH06DRAFT_1296923 [Mycena polygramma]|nr:hypothetical protein DFH06DRAFT_1296923 [Mycena polygramma]
MPYVDLFSKAEAPKSHYSIKTTRLGEFDGFRRFPAGTISCTLCQDVLYFNFEWAFSFFIAQFAKFDLLGPKSEKIKNPDCDNKIFGAKYYHGQFGLDCMLLGMNWDTRHAQLWQLSGILAMGRRTNHQKARMSSLQKARESRKPTVEEVPDEDDPVHPVSDSETASHHGDHLHHHETSPVSDSEAGDSWEFDFGDDFPDLDCDDMSDHGQEPDLDEEIIAAPEITDEVELDSFSKFLFDAQAIAQKAERARSQELKHPGRYLKNSARTKCRNVWNGKQLATKGFLGLQDFREWRMKKKGEELKARAAAMSSDSSSDNASDGEPSSTAQSVSGTGDASQAPSSGSEEEEASDAAPETGESSTQAADCMDPVNLEHVRLKELLDAIQNGTSLSDPTPETDTDRSLNQLNFKNFPALRRAAASLSVKSKDKKLDTFFRARLTAMLGTLNLYLDSQLSYTWREASMIVAKSQGHGSYRARQIRNWIHAFLTAKKLPLHRYGQYHSSILNDEDFSESIKLHLQHLSQKDGHFTAQSLVDFVATPEIQEKLEEADVQKRSISWPPASAVPKSCA